VYSPDDSVSYAAYGLNPADIHTCLDGQLDLNQRIFLPL
jgi:hypothetical protein